ncbi:MAG: DinB family protein [Actinobacteria bacterium]|nr:DinB family protein [Actinomycetota bacterium]
MIGPDEAIEIIARGHRHMLSLLAGISMDELEEPAAIGGGEWSAKDLVGHLTTWEEIAIASIEEWRRGERPVIEDTFAGAGGDALNADEVARKSVLSMQEILRRSDEVHRGLAAMLGGITAEEWAQAAAYAPEAETTLGSLVGGILGSDAGPFQHFRAHQRDLRAFWELHAPG